VKGPTPDPCGECESCIALAPDGPDVGHDSSRLTLTGREGDDHLGAACPQQLRGHCREGFEPGFAVVNDLQHLQRLYDLNGRESEMRDIYHDVLLKTQVPAIRQYVYEALARNLLRPTNVDQAITTIRTSLDEDLSTLAKHPSAP